MAPPRTGVRHAAARLLSSHRTRTGVGRTDVLHHFTGGKEETDPWAALIFDQAGNLYGTTRKGGNLSYCDGQGCGVVFKLTPDGNGGWKKTLLHSLSIAREPVLGRACL